MDNNGTANTPSAPPPAARVQKSIHSFFQPRTPTYSAPPIANPTTSPAPPIPNSSPPRAGANNSASSSTSSPSLPPQAIIVPIDSSHIQALRRINSLLLPVNYPDSFYHKIVDPSTPPFSRVILWADNPSTPPKVVGGIVCRLDPSLAPDSTPQIPKYVDGVYDIYVQSLVLLSPYRGMGMAAAALQSVIDAATQQIMFKIGALYAHVWTDNTEGLEWYAARGFLKEEPVLTGYYKRLKPDSAWILKRRLGVNDHLAQPSVSAPSRNVATTVTAPPKSLPNQTRPPAAPHTASFQDRRPDREWNDLPEDMSSSLLKPPSATSTRDASAASSRSSSRSGVGKKKKERAYPAAAFGS
jgi:GNAT superfamily N-acetyltransferase